MDAWRTGPHLEDNAPNWLELPVIGEMDSFERTQVAPLFVPAESVTVPLGAATEGMSVVVIDRAGHVLHCQTGDYTAEEATAVSHALRGAN